MALGSVGRVGVGRFLRSWGLAIALAVTSFVSWEAAKRGDTDEVSTEPVPYDQALATPMLSARRVPRTLQAPVADDNLQPHINAVINGSPQTSCVMVQVGDRVIAERTRPTGLIPASNQKVLTTYAALLELGPDFRYQTRVVADTAPDADGVVDGNLYFVGAGDPFLGTDDFWAQYPDEIAGGRYHTRLEDLTDAIVAAGVTQVTGQIIGDESLFDAQRAGPWPERFISPQNQAGPLSALSVNEGFADWPAAWPGHSRQRSRADDPPVNAAAVLGSLLAEREVTVGAGFAAGATPALGSVEIAMVESPPLLDLVTHINSYSSNYGAELLLKTLGSVHTGSGTTVAGAAAVQELLAADGVPVEGLVVQDGSGLAETNRLTCQALVAVLANAGAGSAFAETLAVGGERGTLAQRFVDTPVQGEVYAKTGTLNESSSLAGYVGSGNEDGTWITFAYVANDDLVDHGAIRDLQDPFVVNLSSYPGRPAIAELQPLEPIAR